jgi:hypothetical protein
MLLSRGKNTVCKVEVVCDWAGSYCVTVDPTIYPFLSGNEVFYHYQ